MEASELVNFEIYWKGASVSNDVSQVSCIDVKMKDVPYSIEGRINKQLPLGQEQRLEIHTELLEGDTFTKCYSRKMSFSIFCSPLQSTTMKISARIFEYYEDRSGRVCGRSGQTRARRYDQPISLGQLPNFQSGKAYQIKVNYEDDKFSVVFHEKVGGGKALFDSGVDHLKLAAAMTPNGLTGKQIEEAGTGLRKMAEIASGKEKNIEYEKMSIQALQSELEAAKENLRQKRKDFDGALSSQQRECIAKELDAKQKAMQVVLGIENALRKKGVDVKEDAPHCLQS